MESKQRRLYAIVAGVCFIVAGVLEGTQNVINIMNTIRHNGEFHLFFHQISGFLVAAISIAFGIVWLINNKRLFSWIIGSLYCIVCFVEAVVFAKSQLRILPVSSEFSSWYHRNLIQLVIEIITMVVCVSLLLNIVLAHMIPATAAKLKPRFNCVLHIIPAVLSFLNIVAYALLQGYGVGFFSSLIYHLQYFPHLFEQIIITFFEYIFVTIALFMSGLWCSNPVFQKKALTPAPAAPLIGRAERLQQYKDLLDAGVLTQAEFDAKKAEILHP